MKNRFDTVPKLLVLAIAHLPFTAAEVAAEDDTVEQLIRPESSVRIGIGSVNRDNQHFGMYNGLNDEGEFLTGDLDLVRRDDTTGTWIRLSARDAGLPTQEYRAEYERQGRFGAFLEYSETPRLTPYDVHTDVAGIGSAVLTMPPAGAAASTAGPTTIGTERQKTVLGMKKILDSHWEFTARLQSEEKNGTRLFGRGTAGAVSLNEFLAEPIDNTTQIVDLTVNYLGERFQASAGYYGSFFNNRHAALDVVGGNGALASTAAGNIPFSPIALPPDSYAHQFHLSGAYNFTPSTRGTFRLAHTRATQEDAFIPSAANGTNISGRTDLGGRLDTTLAQLGLTARPTPQLSLLANLRYEDRHDKTAVAQYLSPPAVPADCADPAVYACNEPRSLTILAGRIEGSYALPHRMRLTAGLDREEKERELLGRRITNFRYETDEDTLRLALTAPLGATVGGSLGVSWSERDGSGYLPTTVPGALQPIYLADRERARLRASADWSPSDQLALQFVIESSDDDYGRGLDPTVDVGARSGDSQMYSLDISYALNERWRLTAFASRLRTEIEQASATATRTTPASAATIWTAAMRNTGDTVGVGARGSIGEKWTVGGDLLIGRDHSRYRLGGSATESLPDILNRGNTYKLFARYAVSKDSAVQVNYVYDRYRSDDWTWNGDGTLPGWTYTDGTWIEQDPDQTVRFLGLSYEHRFR